MRRPVKFHEQPHEQQARHGADEKLFRSGQPVHAVTLTLRLSFGKRAELLNLNRHRNHNPILADYD
jgi:hypothetical protein